MRNSRKRRGRRAEPASISRAFRPNSRGVRGGVAAAGAGAIRPAPIPIWTYGSPIGAANGDPQGTGRRRRAGSAGPGTIGLPGARDGAVAKATAGDVLAILGRRAGPQARILGAGARGEGGIETAPAPRGISPCDRAGAGLPGTGAGRAGNLDMLDVGPFETGAVEVYDIAGTGDRRGLPGTAPGAGNGARNARGADAALRGGIGARGRSLYQNGKRLCYGIKCLHRFRMMIPRFPHRFHMTIPRFLHRFLVAVFFRFRAALIRFRAALFGAAALPIEPRHHCDTGPYPAGRNENRHCGFRSRDPCQ